MPDSPGVLGLKVLFEGPEPCVEESPTKLSHLHLCTDHFMLPSIVDVHGLASGLGMD